MALNIPEETLGNAQIQPHLHQPTPQGRPATRKPSRKVPRNRPLANASPAKRRSASANGPPRAPTPPPLPALPLSFTAMHNVRSHCKPLAGYDDSEGRRIALRIKMLEAYGGQEPRGFQLDAILAVLNRRDVAVRAATGSGKSRVAEGVALNFEPGECVVVVLVPLEELGNDQVFQKRRAGFTAVNITDQNWNLALAKRIAQGHEQFVYLSPERFNKNGLWRDAVVKDPDFARRVRCLCIDEAYLVYQWGLIKTGRQHTVALTRNDRTAFREDYSQIAVHRASLAYTPLLLLSATMTPKALSLICRSLQLNESDLVTLDAELYRPNLRLIRAPSQHTVKSAGEATRLLGSGGLSSRKPPTIIYANSRRYTGDIVQTLHEHVGMDTNVPRSTLARRYHSVTADADKSEFIRDFRRRRFPFAVATSALGLGMNLSFIRVVVQLGLCPPPDLFQRWGRIRDQQPGLCLLFTKSAPPIRSRRSTPESGEESGTESDGVPSREEVVEDDEPQHATANGRGNDHSKGESAREQNEAMRALEKTNVYLWVALLLYLRTGVVPTNPSAPAARSELARINSISPCQCSNCEPDIASALVSNLGLITKESFFSAMQDPRAFARDAEAARRSLPPLGPARSPEVRTPNPVVDCIRRLGQHTTEAQLVDLQQRLLGSFRSFFSEAYGTPSSTLLSADAFFSSTMAEKLAQRAIDLQGWPDITAIFGSEPLEARRGRRSGTTRAESAASTTASRRTKGEEGC